MVWGLGLAQAKYNGAGIWVGPSATVTIAASSFAHNTVRVAPRRRLPVVCLISHSPYQALRCARHGAGEDLRRGHLRPRHHDDQNGVYQGQQLRVQHGTLQRDPSAKTLLSHRPLLLLVPPRPHPKPAFNTIMPHREERGEQPPPLARNCRSEDSLRRPSTRQAIYGAGNRHHSHAREPDARQRPGPRHAPRAHGGGGSLRGVAGGAGGGKERLRRRCVPVTSPLHPRLGPGAPAPSFFLSCHGSHRIAEFAAATPVVLKC